jgi:hypothetical protein
MDKETDPKRMLLNVAGFRQKFHIYEVLQRLDSQTNEIQYVIRKQLLTTASQTSIQEVRVDQQHREVTVPREALADIFELGRSLTLPLARKGQVGKDGTWYTLQIGVPPVSTTIRWWSDSEPELRGVYQLRNQIVETINAIMRTPRSS